MSRPSTAVIGVSGVTTTSVQPCAGVHDAVVVGDGGECTHDGGAGGDDVPAVAPDRVDQVGGLAGNAVALGVGALAAFE